MTMQTQEKAHATLGASSAERWMTCPGSVRLSVGMPKKSSVFAAEGTAAHELAERCLRSGEDAAAHLGTLIDTDNGTFEVDAEMVEAVQLYLNTVRADLIDTPNAVFEVEKKFKLTWLSDGLFGTNDACVGEHFGLLRVYDLKYGRGVPVEVEANPQLLYYGLGAAYDGDYSEIELIVVQPRARHKNGPVRRWRTSIAELEAWGRDVLLPAALATEAPDAPLKSSPKGCRFCTAAPICPQIRKTALENIQAEFDDDFLPAAGKEITLPDPREMNAETLGRTLALWEMLEPWGKAVRETVKDLLTEGKDVPGWKMVAGRKGNRVWSKPEAEIAATLWELGDELYEPRKLLSPAKVEKLFPKKKEAKAILAELVTQADGQPALAPEYDARPAIQSQATVLESFND
jgi:hypothetical protein